MHCARSSIVRLVLVLGAAIAALSCSKDDIPTTPSAPFMTGAAVSKILSPVGGTTLTQGQQYNAQFDVYYTLSPVDDARRGNLEIYGVVYYQDAQTDSLFALPGFAVQPPTLTSSVVRLNLTFNAPSGANFVGVEGGVAVKGIVRDTTIAFMDLPSWIVK